MRALKVSLGSVTVLLVVVWAASGFPVSRLPEVVFCEKHAPLVLDKTADYSFRPGNGYTVVSPDPRAKGDVLELHQEIASQLSKLDPRPEFRLSHFQNVIRELPGKNWWCLGWRGTILDVSRSDAGWVVKVRFKADLASPSDGLMNISDCVDEVYQYSDDGLDYLSASVPPGVAGSISWY